MVLGTSTYMSPENLRGQDVDARTDIFSLGVTLYELIAGVAPFEGRTPVEITDAILEREPPPLGWYRPGVPRDLEHIISKALRKDRDCRYQHTRDLLIDLQDVKQEQEFEATFRRSARYELIDQSRAIAPAAQCGVEANQSTGGQEGQSSLPPSVSTSPMIPPEIMNDKLPAAIASVLRAEISMVILVGLKSCGPQIPDGPNETGEQ
jgi:serine/threonine protein kinase